jgi:hypothetical protein
MTECSLTREQLEAALNFAKLFKQRVEAGKPVSLEGLTHIVARRQKDSPLATFDLYYGEDRRQMEEV